MFKVLNFYFGFTDNIKEPRKTKVENMLNKLYRYNDGIYNAVGLFCKKLLEGCYLEKEEGYTYIKRNGEYSKPKNLYKLKESDGNSYFEINKTQYDFVEYLINNGYTTESAMEKAIVDHKERMENLKKQQEEEQRIALGKEEQERKEIERIKALLEKDMENLSEVEKKICDDIFLDVYGYGNNNSCYTLLSLIHYYDNPYCKNEIKERLHNGNKASIKIFECITGLKLPKTYKDRMEYLDSITSADFKESVEYKTRKKSEYKESEEVYISYGNRMHMEWKKIMAECFTKYGIDFFIVRDGNQWKISVKRVGLLVAIGETRSEAMEKLKETINNIGGIEATKKLIENNIILIEQLAGVNPLYKTA